MKKPLLWVVSFVVTLGFALFQRMTGPTYPVRSSGVEVPGAAAVSYRFPRSCTTGGDDCVPRVTSAAPAEGYLLWKRYRTGDEPQVLPMAYEAGRLTARLPDQPPAGKLEYRVFLRTQAGETELAKAPVVTRFKGAVPHFILIPHILMMFLFMLFSVRIFVSAAWNLPQPRFAVPLNVAFLALGGFLFGPLTQKYAFGQLWTGFPFGYDLTDNKTLVMMIFWLAGLAAFLKEKKPRFWLITAFIVTAAIYLVPHSMFGSELDYGKGEVVTGRK
ncbi:MAG: hypothetical protein M0025_01875 [Elusimicrobia bacterium]|nr:hypothetical protein [Elusimicrobiota bacterium]